MKWNKLQIYTVVDFPGGSVGKESTCNARDTGDCRFDPLVGKILWRRAWQPTPVFLPGEFHGQRGLVEHSSWGHKEADRTEVTEHIHKHNTMDQAQKVYAE